MKNSKFKNVIVVILFVIIIALPSIAYWVSGQSFVKEAAQEKHKISELYEGKFRDNLLPILSEKLAPPWYKAFQEEEAKKAMEEKMRDHTLDDVPTIPEGLSYLAPTTQGTVIIGRNGWLFTSHANGLNYYLGQDVMSEEEMSEWKDSFQKVSDILAERGASFALLFGPDKQEVYPEYMPTYEIETPYKRHIMFEKYMHENSTVNYYYPIRELAAQKGKQDTYYQCDTHWNDVGGLLSAAKIHEAFHIPMYLGDVEIYTEPTTFGDMGWVTGNSVEYTDYKVNYKKNITVEEDVWDDQWDIDSYGKTTTSSNKNGKRLIVFGDSFRVAFGKIMQKDFETMSIMQRELLITDDNEQAKEIIRNIKEGDCVVFIGTERLDWLIKKMSDRFYEVITQ